MHFNKIQLRNILKISHNPRYFILFLFIISRLPLLIIINYTKIPSTSLFTALCREDCVEYMQIILNGYTHIPASLVNMANDKINWAFFPLFPFLIKNLLLLSNHLIYGIILNQLLLLGSMYLLYTYTKKEYSEKIAKRATLLLAFSSINIYMATLYTEALFLFISLLSINAIHSKKFFKASLLNGLLSATRVQGTLMLVPFTYSYIQKNIKSWQRKNSIELIFMLCCSLSGLMLFMIFLHYWVGDSLAFLHIQAAWGKYHHSWLHPIDVFLNWRSGKTLDFIAFFIVTPWCIYYFFQQKRWNEFLLIFAVFSVSLLSQSSQSFLRFITACYCLYIAIGAQEKYFKYFVIIMIIINFMFILSWLTNSSVYA